MGGRKRAKELLFCGGAEGSGGMGGRMEEMEVTVGREGRVERLLLLRPAGRQEEVEETLAVFCLETKEEQGKVEERVVTEREEGVLLRVVVLEVELGEGHLLGLLLLSGVDPLGQNINREEHKIICHLLGDHLVDGFELEPHHGEEEVEVEGFADRSNQRDLADSLDRPGREGNIKEAFRLDSSEGKKTDLAVPALLVPALLTARRCLCRLRT